MPALPAWGARLLYAFLIAHLDKDANPIPPESIENALVDLFERLKERLGGFTRIKPFEAVGETTVWGQELCFLHNSIRDTLDHRNRSRQTPAQLLESARLNAHSGIRFASLLNPRLIVEQGGNRLVPVCKLQSLSLCPSEFSSFPTNVAFWSSFGVAS